MPVSVQMIAVVLLSAVTVSFLAAYRVGEKAGESGHFFAALFNRPVIIDP